MQRVVSAILAAVILFLQVKLAMSGPFALPVWMACITGCAVVCGSAAGAAPAVGPAAILAMGPACVACMETCLGPGVAIAAATCQDGGSHVTTKQDGPKPLWTVLPGTHIATLNEAKDMVYTPVTRNFKEEGSFHFVEVVFETERAVNVTDEHLMVVDRGEGFQLQQAMAVRIGDVMLTADGQTAKVTSTRGFLSREKWILETAEGTALVNGVQMTTICEDNMDALPKEYDTAMHAWREVHSARRQLKPEDIKRSSDYVSGSRNADDNGDGRASVRELVKAIFHDVCKSQKQYVQSDVKGDRKLSHEGMTTGLMTHRSHGGTGNVTKWDSFAAFGTNTDANCDGDTDYIRNLVFAYLDQGRDRDFDTKISWKGK